MSEVFHRLSVASVRRLTGDAVEVTFVTPEASAAALAFKPGQHVPVRMVIDSIEQRRTYSLCSAPDGPLRIGIKHVPGGAVSSFAITQLKAGDVVDVAAPQGRFVLPAGSGVPRHLLMLAAGAGITPILGMINAALSQEPDTRITLVYGNRTLDDAMFLTELEDLKDRHPARLAIVHVLSGAGVADTDLLQGRMTGEKLKIFADKLIDIKSVERVFLCGPGSFIKETRNALFELGFARENVHHEFFAGRTGGAVPADAVRPKPPTQVTAASTVGVDTTIILDGQRHKIKLQPGQHVLEAALKAGIKAPYSCTGGMCSTCRARVVEGTTTMTVNYSLEDWEIQRGFVLTCQAVATSPTLIIDYDAM